MQAGLSRYKTFLNHAENVFIAHTYLRPKANDFDI